MGNNSTSESMSTFILSTFTYMFYVHTYVGMLGFIVIVVGKVSRIHIIAPLEVRSSEEVN